MPSTPSSPTRRNSAGRSAVKQPRRFHSSGLSFMRRFGVSRLFFNIEITAAQCSSNSDVRILSFKALHQKPHFVSKPVLIWSCVVALDWLNLQILNRNTTETLPNCIVTKALPTCRDGMGRRPLLFLCFRFVERFWVLKQSRCRAGRGRPP